MFDHIIERLAFYIDNGLNQDGAENIIANVGMSPQGKPPPSTLKPFVAIGQGSTVPIPNPGSLKYITTVDVIGSIRVRPSLVETYYKPYLELLGIMSKVMKIVNNNVDFANEVKTQALAFGFQSHGFTYISRMSLSPRLAPPSWFESKDKTHGTRDIGYIIPMTVTLPALTQFIDCVPE